MSLARAIVAMMEVVAPGVLDDLVDELSPGELPRASVPVRGSLACVNCDRVFSGPGRCPNCLSGSAVRLERYYPSIDGTKEGWWTPAPETSLEGS